MARNSNLRFSKISYLEPLADVSSDEVHKSEFGEGLVPGKDQILAVEENEVHLSGNEEEASGRYKSAQRSFSEFGADLQTREHETSCSETYCTQA